VPVTALPAGRERFAVTNLAKFCLLAAQALLLLAVFHVYQIENFIFERMVWIAFGACAIHYWLPFRVKEMFLVAVSVAAAFWLLDDVKVAGMLVGIGLIFYGILRLRLAFLWRGLAVAAIFAALIYGQWMHRLPAGFPAIFGALFMFRMMIYLYDLAHSTEPPQFIPYMSYFFILPNYCFTLFPVIDFATMRRTYYQRDIHAIVQRGLHWMLRGTVQLLLARILFYLNDRYTLDRVNTLPALLATIVLTYLLYMKVSGHYHIAVGILHLFGYDLPETYRNYFLASSLTDFWRRANIYWKDFMLKIVYYPIFFKLRGNGTLLAQIIATVAVFFTTWGLHAYQSFWLTGNWGVRATDSIFWILLGVLFLATMLWENRRKPGPRKPPGLAGKALQAVKIAVTFSVVAFLWFLWSAPSLDRWVYLMTHWMGGR
jgi:D-alanyl-lipoteichoic acid acyltransferase DltB (MBOAT superfamily)